MKKVTMFTSYMFSTALSVILFITFLWSYFSNDYTFSISINSLGEAHIELIVLSAVMIFILYGACVSYSFCGGRQMFNSEVKQNE